MADPTPKTPQASRPAGDPTDPDVPLMMAVRDPNVHRVYANGFTLGLTNADTHIVLQWFGRPIAIVNLSYTLAKTLSQRLAKMVEDWEKKTGQPLATTDKIDEAYKDDPRAKRNE
jgi:hypothetical protein